MRFRTWSIRASPIIFFEKKSLHQKYINTLFLMVVFLGVGGFLEIIGDNNLSPVEPTEKLGTYELELRQIKQQIGSLESIRGSLGLSQRKMAQLLLVDPSAWSRWAAKDSAPPHIMRALQWYLALNEKIPGLTPQYFSDRVQRKGSEQIKDFLELKAHIKILQTELLELKKNQTQPKLNWMGLINFKNNFINIYFLLMLIFSGFLIYYFW